jgi:hypothetical protein
VAADEQAVGIATRHIHELETLKFVGVLAYVKAVGQDDWTDFEATTAILAIGGPVPVLGLGGEGLRAHKVGYVAQGLWNAAGVLRAEVVIVVTHDGVEVCLLRDHLADGSEECGSVPVLVEEGVIMLVWMD